VSGPTTGPGVALSVTRLEYEVEELGSILGKRRSISQSCSGRLRRRVQWREPA
jgi:hypothetical protein